MPCLFFVYPDRHRENSWSANPALSVFVQVFKAKKQYKCHAAALRFFFMPYNDFPQIRRSQFALRLPGAAHEHSPCHACPERQSPGALSKLRARWPRRPWLLPPRHRLFGLAVRRSTLWRFQHPIFALATTTRMTMGRAKKTPLARRMITRQLSMGRARCEMRIAGMGPEGPGAPARSMRLTSTSLSAGRSGLVG